MEMDPDPTLSMTQKNRLGLRTYAYDQTGNQDIRGPRGREVRRLPPCVLAPAIRLDYARRRLEPLGPS